MSILKSVVIMSLMIGFSAVSLASDNAQLTQQRTTFQQAKKALETHQLDRFNTLRDKLKDYPLQPYLDYLYLRHRLHLTDNSTISRFIQENPNTFYADRLRNSWLEQLARNKQWSLFLNHLPSPASTSQQCLRLDALIATGKATQAYADTPALWLVGYSQDQKCDSAFKYWQAKGFLTNELRWQRIQLALRDNQFSMAKYLARPLDNHHQAHTWIPLWEQSHSQPLTVLQRRTASALKQDNAISREIIKHAIERLSRKSTDQAYAYWQTLQSKYQFSKQDNNSIQSTIGNRAALNREQRTLEYFGDLPDEQWRVRAALWQQDWKSVKKAILSLNSEEQASTRWQYWLGRSQAQLGDKQAANQTFQNIVSQRDYYSFLAADQLGQPYQMNHRPIVFEQTELNIFSQIPAVARLREFYIMDMQLEARRQAYELKLSMSPRELQLLATLTHQWQWHNQTIALLGKAQYWDALDLRFPILFDTAILKASKINGVDPSWLFGITRQESAFNPHARSPVGASGLIQIEI